MLLIDSRRGASLFKPGASGLFDWRCIAFFIVATLAWPTAAQEPRPKPADVETTIKRGLGFLAKDALAWKDKNNCARATMPVWSSGRCVKPNSAAATSMRRSWPS